MLFFLHLYPLQASVKSLMSPKLPILHPHKPIFQHEKYSISGAWPQQMVLYDIKIWLCNVKTMGRSHREFSTRPIYTLFVYILQVPKHAVSIQCYTLHILLLECCISKSISTIVVLHKSFHSAGSSSSHWLQLDFIFIVSITSTRLTRIIQSSGVPWPHRLH